MKIRIFGKVRQMASTLLVTLVICVLLGVGITGYLSLVQHQRALSSRSQAWNLTMTLVEAGVEEALQHLNEHTSDLSHGDWDPLGSEGYVCDRTLPSGGYRAIIYVTNGISSPVIVSTATVRLNYWASAPLRMVFAAVGVTGDAGYITRKVRVTCYRGANFPNAIVAKEGIKMNGNNVKVDSFRSCDWPDRRYDSTRALSKGDVASNGSLIDAGNANIYGHVSTGPGGSVQVGNNGAVGSYAWQNAGNRGIQPGWFSDTSNFVFADTRLPYNSGLEPIGGVDILVTNVTSSATITNTSYPNPAPLTGVITNTSWATLSYKPNPAPAGLVAVTNNVTSSSVPNPLPATMTTNSVQVTESGFPTAGTYIGLVATNFQGNKVKNYTFNRITGYTYPVVSYKYPISTYVYSLYSTNAIYTTNTYDHILHSGEYYATSLTGKTLVKGEVTLVLPNGFSMGSGDTLQILGTGKLTMYVGGTSCKLSGNDVVNEGGYAGNFILYCAPSVTSFDLSGNAHFTGIIYAPNADLKFNGGGHDTFDMIGALVAKTITLNGHFNVHYDECLGDDTSNNLFVVRSWDELY